MTVFFFVLRAAIQVCETHALCGAAYGPVGLAKFVLAVRCGPNHWTRLTRFSSRSLRFGFRDSAPAHKGVRFEVDHNSHSMTSATRLIQRRSIFIIFNASVDRHKASG